MAAAATANPEAQAQAQWRPKTNPWIIAATVAMAAFMEVLDTSIANVALPHIAGNLGASGDQSTWVLTAYLVSNAIVLPMGGWASSVIGRKNFFMLCIVIFTCRAPCVRDCLEPADSCCSFGSSRASGGGGLQPMAQAIMADSFEDPPEARAWRLRSTGWSPCWRLRSGPRWAAGSPTTTSWHWIFYINIPVGILAFVLTSRLVEDPPYGSRPTERTFTSWITSGWAAGDRHGRAADRPRQGRGERLVRIELHSRLWAAFVDLFCRL
jgi:DHA2 family multidrug resistance protein